MRKAIVFVGFALFTASSIAAQEVTPVSPFRKPYLVWNDLGTPVIQRIARGLAFLREELASPTPRQWGTGVGGPIYLDTGVMQGNLVFALGMAGMDARSVLQNLHDREKSPRLRDLLTVSLGLTGSRQTIPELLNISRSDAQGAIRAQAIQALTFFIEKPTGEWQMKRLAPGEKWKPLDRETKRKIERILLVSLDDPYELYKADCLSETVEYPVRLHAVYGLRALGYQLKPDNINGGYTSMLVEPGGKPLQRIQVYRSVHERDLPSDIKPRGT